MRLTMFGKQCTFRLFQTLMKGKKLWTNKSSYSIGGI